MTAIRFREVVECSLCGAEIALETDAHFALDEHAALCFSCAVSRGGVYDDSSRQWLGLPNTIGIVTALAHLPRRYSAAFAAE